jgi:hypothetical protein
MDACASILILLHSTGLGFAGVMSVEDDVTPVHLTQNVRMKL